MVSLLVHAALGVVVIGWIVSSNPKVFTRPAGGSWFSLPECVYYVVGIASIALGWYFNIRFVQQYAHGAANPLWGPGSWAEYVRLMYHQPGGQFGRPGLHHCQRDPAAAVFHHRRLPTWSAAALAVFREQPVHQFCIRVRVLLRHHRTSAPTRTFPCDGRRLGGDWLGGPPPQASARDIDVDISESHSSQPTGEVRRGDRSVGVGDVY